jgi:hypothetical protein
MYKRFIQWMNETKVSLPVDNSWDKDLTFGAFGAMKRIIPQIGEFGHNDTHKFGGKFQADTSMNPWLLVAWDNTNKRLAFGSLNCNVCKKYDTKQRTCSRFDQSHPVTQSSIRQHDIGGCVAIQLIDPLAGGGIMDTGSKKYEGIMAAVGKGAIFHLKRGKLTMLYRPGEIPVDEEEEEYRSLSAYEKDERERYGN